MSLDAGQLIAPCIKFDKVLSLLVIQVSLSRTGSRS